MPCIENFERYPYILQEKDDWCIHASIENLMRFYKVKISQQQIDDYFKKEHGTRGMCLDTMADILKNHYNSDLEFQVINHKNKTELLHYIEDKISKDKIPVIVSIKNPDDTAHMLTILCMDKDKFLVFDTDGRPKPMNWPRQELIDRLSKGFGTLIIRSL